MKTKLTMHQLLTHDYLKSSIHRYAEGEISKEDLVGELKYWKRETYFPDRTCI